MSKKNVPENNQIAVKIVFFSTLKNITGENSITLEIPVNTKIFEVLKKVQIKYFKSKNSKLLEENEKSLAIGLICLVNDVDISLSGGLHHHLKKNCTITLISSLHGG